MIPCPAMLLTMILAVEDLDFLNKEGWIPRHLVISQGIGDIEAVVDLVVVVGHVVAIMEEAMAMLEGGEGIICTGPFSSYFLLCPTEIRLGLLGAL